MRLLPACLVILLAPTGALLLTQRSLERSEAEFWEDSSSQVDRLNRVVALYPPNVRRMKSAPAIMRLRELRDGNQVATNVCYSSPALYERLFERLSMRCGQWLVFRRAYRFAIGALVVSVIMMGAVLMAKIIVRRALSLQEWPGEWSVVYAKHGVAVLMLGHAGFSSIAYWILLKDSLSKPAYSWAVLILSILLVFWLQRLLAMSFVNAGEIAALRPRRTKATGDAGPDASHAAEAGTGSAIGIARRRRGQVDAERFPHNALVKPSVAPPPHSPESAES